MEERETARPKGWEFGGGEPRGSLIRAWLVFIAMLGLLVFAGVGLAGVFVLIMESLDQLALSEVPLRYSFGYSLVYSYAAVATLPSIGACLLCLLAVLPSHLRRTTFGATWTSLTSIVMAAAVIVAMLPSIGLFISFPPAAATILIAIIGLYLLRSRNRRLRLFRNGSAAPEKGLSRVGVMLALALMLGGSVAALIGVVNYEPIIASAEDRFRFANHAESIAPIVVFSNLFWQAALWLLVPLTLMASDNCLFRRDRIKGASGVGEVEDMAAGRGATEDEQEAGSGRQRQLIPVRLALIGTLGMLVFAGIGMIGAIVITVRILESESSWSYFIFALSIALSMAALLLGVLSALTEHLRGVPLGNVWKALVYAALNVLIISALLVTLPVSSEFSAVPALFSLAYAILSVYLLYRRAGWRRTQVVNTVNHGDGLWLIGGGFALAVIAFGILAAIFTDFSRSDPLAPLDWVINSLVWQLATWLLVPLALMASDSYLLLRRRLKQDREDAAGAAS